jgi:hypothetical protein
VCGCVCAIPGSRDILKSEFRSRRLVFRHEREERRKPERKWTSKNITSYHDVIFFIWIFGEGEKSEERGSEHPLPSPTDRPHLSLFFMAAAEDIPADTSSALMKALAGELEEAAALSARALITHPDNPQAIAVNVVISKRFDGRKTLLDDLTRLTFPLKDFGGVATVCGGVEVGYSVFGSGGTESGQLSESWLQQQHREGGEGEGGKVVLFFHGLPGSRHFLTPSLHTSCAAADITAVLMERPSYGLSSDVSVWSEELWNDIVLEFMCSLGLEHSKIALIAYSGGCPYALSLAAGKASRLFSSISIVSCPSPPITGVTNDLGFTSKLGYFFARNSSWLLEKCMLFVLCGFPSSTLKVRFFSDLPSFFPSLSLSLSLFSLSLSSLSLSLSLVVCVAMGLQVLPTSRPR